MRLVIVTGMSGAGKTSALKMLEDLGFYCVDNLPIPLMEAFVELVMQKPVAHEEVALGIDIRSGEELPQLEQVFRIRRQAVALECAFTGGSLRVTCFLQVRLLVLDVLALALRYGLRAYRIYRSQTAPESSAADGGEAEA